MFEKPLQFLPCITSDFAVDCRAFIFAERDERVVASIPRPRPFPLVTRPLAGELAPPVLQFKRNISIKLNQLVDRPEKQKKTETQNNKPKQKRV